MWFKSYFSKRIQSFESNGLKYSLQRTGIPHGSIHSPLVFILYINDLPLFCLDAHHPSKLQYVFNVVYSWFICNRLAISIEKTYGYVFCIE